MTRIYGHRGARGEVLENTIAGFLHAFSCGVAGIETDIAMTADFIPVLHHDPALPDGRLIRHLDLAELPGIPTLAAALRAVPEIEWLLEIKTYPATPELSHPPACMAHYVLEALQDARIPAWRVAILAFDWAVLAELAGRAPEISRICLTSPETEAKPALWQGRPEAQLSTPACVAANGAQGWAPFHETLTLSQIREAHTNGLKIFPWTVNLPQDFQRLAPLVDGIITDYPGQFTPPR